MSIQDYLKPFYNPFQSFWMGGYECSDKLNAFGNRVDLLCETGHIALVNEDYARLHPFNISTVREGIRWNQVEKSPYQYDWSIVGRMLQAGQQQGIQQVWDICHFGFPDDLTPLHPMFARRFAALCRSFVQYYKDNSSNILIVTPINEVGFLSWLGGDVRGTAPYCVNYGWEVKYALMRAYIEGVAEMKRLDPGMLILSTEPLVNIVYGDDASEEEMEAAIQANDDQFQTLDILTGNICPELGGKPEYLDIIGLNFHYNNRWELNSKAVLPWVNDQYDSRWLPLNQIVADVYARYGRPVIIAETSHPGEHRPNWIKHIAEECAVLLENDVPLWGICLYPIIDRPDWDHPHIWHHSGLWDEAPDNGQFFERILNIEYATGLLEAQEIIETCKQNIAIVNQYAIS
jgi:hypothetical protein